MSDDTTQPTLTGDAQTTLVNMSRYGREGVTPIDRSTQFGNPFRLEKDGGEYTREESVEAYREWFHEQIENDSEFRQAVEGLRGRRLVVGGPRRATAR